MPVVGGDLLPFLPRVSGTYLLVFIYPFIGYADFCLSIYIRILHVILKVVVFPPRASQHQLAQSAYRWGSLYHIDTYEQVAGYTTGRAYRKSSGGWGAQQFRGVRGCEGDGSFVLLTAASAASGEFFLPPRSFRYSSV